MNTGSNTRKARLTISRICQIASGLIDVTKVSSGRAPPATAREAQLIADELLRVRAIVAHTRTLISRAREHSDSIDDRIDGLEGGGAR